MPYSGRRNRLSGQARQFQYKWFQIPLPEHFSVLASDSQSGMTVPHHMVARDVDSFQAVWAQHYAWLTPAPPLPQVDFTRKMVVAIFGGERPTGCPRLGITEVVPENEGISVSYALRVDYTRRC